MTVELYAEHMPRALAELACEYYVDRSHAEDLMRVLNEGSRLIARMNERTPDQRRTLHMDMMCQFMKQSQHWWIYGRFIRPVPQLESEYLVKLEAIAHHPIIYASNTRGWPTS
jgi:hypothetical protein